MRIKLSSNFNFTIDVMFSETDAHNGTLLVPILQRFAEAVAGMDDFNSDSSDGKQTV